MNSFSSDTTRFLSCLFGSERQRGTGIRPDGFLSCLFGSEQTQLDEIAQQMFLSCLFGSERAGGARLQL